MQTNPDRNDLFKDLENSGIQMTDEQKRKISNKLDEVLNYEPKVAVFGKTGVGKSSLCNSLFGKDLFKVSDVESCTRNPQEVILGIGEKGLKILDVPGVGENKERDAEYAELYSRLLPEVDLVLYLIKGDDRAFSSDETFYTEIIKPHIDEGKPFFFVVNQVDKIEPFREWDTEKNEPGAKQFQNIDRKLVEVARVFNYPHSKIIGVSAAEKYNLTKLVDEIIFALPKEKKITMFREVSEENRSAIASEHVKRSFIEVIGDVIGKVIGFVGTILEKLPPWPRWPF